MKQKRSQWYIRSEKNLLPDFQIIKQIIFINFVWNEYFFIKLWFGDEVHKF